MTQKLYNFCLVFNQDGILDSIYKQKEENEAHKRLLFLNYGEKIRAQGYYQKMTWAKYSKLKKMEENK